MNINSEMREKLADAEYRSAFVQSQIDIGIPFQIRALRKERGWTQPYLAEKADMKQSRISAIERPGGPRLNIETLCRLASAFDVALEVRFVPFGELVHQSDNFDPDTFSVPSFDEEIKEVDLKETAAAAVRSSVVQAPRSIGSWINSSELAAIKNYESQTRQMAAAAGLDIQPLPDNIVYDIFWKRDGNLAGSASGDGLSSQETTPSSLGATENAIFNSPRESGALPQLLENFSSSHSPVQDAKPYRPRHRHTFQRRPISPIQRRITNGR